METPAVASQTKPFVVTVAASVWLSHKPSSVIVMETPAVTSQTKLFVVTVAASVWLSHKLWSRYQQIPGGAW